MALASLIAFSASGAPWTRPALASTPDGPLLFY